MVVPFKHIVSSFFQEIDCLVIGFAHRFCLYCQKTTTKQNPNQLKQ